MVLYVICMILLIMVLCMILLMYDIMLHDWYGSNRQHQPRCNYLIGASLSEPLLDELAGALFWYIYIYLYPQSILVPRGPPVNAQRANVKPAE